MPAFTAVYSLLRVHIREGAEILAAGRVSDPHWTLATLNVVQSYDTWRALHDMGLSLGESVELVVDWVRSVA